MGQYYNFKRIRLVHIGVGPASVDRIADATVFFTDDQGENPQSPSPNAVGFAASCGRRVHFRLATTMIGVSSLDLPRIFRRSSFRLKRSSDFGRLLTIHHGSNSWTKSVLSLSSRTTSTYRVRCSGHWPRRAAGTAGTRADGAACLGYFAKSSFTRLFRRELLPIATTGD